MTNTPFTATIVSPQPAHPIGVPLAYVQKQFLVQPVTVGVSYSLTGRHGTDTTPLWDFNWTQDQNSVETVDYDSPRF